MVWVFPCNLLGFANPACPLSMQKIWQGLRGVRLSAAILNNKFPIPIFSDFFKKIDEGSAWGPNNSAFSEGLLTPPVVWSMLPKGLLTPPVVWSMLPEGLLTPPIIWSMLFELIARFCFLCNSSLFATTTMFFRHSIIWRQTESSHRNYDATVVNNKEK